MSGSRRKPGRLGPYVGSYRECLFGLGYTPQTVRGELKVLGQLGRWMETEGVEPAQLDESRLKTFLAGRQAEGFKRVVTLGSFGKLLAHLRAERVVAPRPERPATPLSTFLSSYAQWLATERALAPATVLRYETLARKFLEGRVSLDDELGLQGLDGQHVAAFLLGECARLSLGSAKGRVAELRALLKFLHLKGFTELSLAEAVPPVAGWRDTGVPMTVPSADIERLLASCDRTTVAGCRDSQYWCFSPGWASVRRKWPGWSSTTWTGGQAKS